MRGERSDPLEVGGLWASRYQQPGRVVRLELETEPGLWMVTVVERAESSRAVTVGSIRYLKARTLLRKYDPVKPVDGPGE